jgi:hypothetical protein
LPKLIKTAISTDTLSPAYLTVVKTREQRAWSSGFCAVIGTTLQIVGQTLCEANGSACRRAHAGRGRGEWQYDTCRRPTRVRRHLNRLRARALGPAAQGLRPSILR